ncbi:MAG: leucine-rich repeat domain-containing protein [Spirochaetales bacterium]|nr:leucine-rich repeat domain-containing protein [Spirochaetales bacterium]
MDITSKLTLHYLQTLSRKLIDSYKAGKYHLLDNVYSQLYPEEKQSGQDHSHKKIFFSLIKIFHPDSLNNHLQQVEIALKNNIVKKLDFYQRFTGIRMSSNNKTVLREIFSSNEVYEYETADYDENNYADDVISEADSENDIISIITRIYLGNVSDISLDSIDLAQIDSELILSHHDIDDLDGLEYCINLLHLDLSHNRIDNIYQLQFLENLESLDLSHNDIHDIDVLFKLSKLEILYLDENVLEDISVLTKLESLEFVSITGNPITSMDTISELQQKGVIVIYY